MTTRLLWPVLAVVGALLCAFLANLALPHQVVHGIEAFAAAWSVFLVTRLSVRLAAREKQLEQVAQERARVERLAALTTLAAGAAHELATPLGTIAVIAADVARHPALAEDGKLLRAEVDRCRAILDRLGDDADAYADEAHVSPADLYEAVTARLPNRMRERVDLVVEHGVDELVVPVGAVATAVAGLVKNGVEASAQSGRVRVAIGRDERGAQIVVEDHGTGMPADLAARIGEPFLTTKDAGAGMGLGVFLARLVAERCGGALVVDSELGRGTRMLLDLPAVRA